MFQLVCVCVTNPGISVFIYRLIGAFYGRSLGIGLTYLYRYITGIDIPTDNIWRWIDPGLISVMGAGSMLGGVTRLALASTVIVVSNMYIYTNMELDPELKIIS